LLDLQNTDLQLAAQRQRLSDAERALADESRVEAAEAEVTRLESLLRETQLAQHQHEVNIAAHEQEAGRLSKLLYGGTVRNIRELESLQHELAYQQRQQRDSEDRALAAMERIESLSGELAEARAALERTRQVRAAERAALTAERERLLHELASLERRRTTLAASVDAASLATYERLKARTGGTPVAEVVQGRCSGCRLVLPAMDVQRARLGQAVVYCQSCGRILYVAR
jgi:predicted  nucleic acid-binding Zn-ribbon protein